ncbi:ABC transporter permease subunit [Candidatus Parabeggiatoa sp. HSG14]|uniref:ABC transporter permease n=1 Tax=Candidatus Parabeggiatoa sp. HSG14 TaxID=3055593 RepID=UPI0025A8E170|nr:ABC transporter permease subunit [Thiotrichales bacterium HSG14]
MKEFSVPKLPLDDWIDTSIEYLTNNFAFLTKAISEYLKTGVEVIADGFKFQPLWIVILIFALLIWQLVSRKKGFFIGTWSAILTTFGLGLLGHQELLSHEIITITVFIWLVLWQLAKYHLNILMILKVGLFLILVGLFWYWQLWHGNIMMITFFTLIAWQLAGRNVGIFTFVSFVFFWNLQLWEPTIDTLTLVLLATITAVTIGIPLGIIAALSQKFYKIIMPILDFMQTMPAFVYLIPAIPFFGIGKVSAIFTTVVFAMPPAIRFTCLGIKQVQPELIEAANAFGSTTYQKLFKLQLPIAIPTIMAGINQTIMLALSMVVIAAMIGAKGLGGEVWTAIQRLEAGRGFQAGIAIVILAMILDRISQKIGKNNQF